MTTNQRPALGWRASRTTHRAPLLLALAVCAFSRNGVNVVAFDLATPRLDSLLARSKYGSIPGFAERRSGHIVLQDHGDEVHFRSIKIRELSDTRR